MPNTTRYTSFESVRADSSRHHCVESGLWGHSTIAEYETLSKPHPWWRLFENRAVDGVVDDRLGVLPDTPTGSVN